MSQVKPSAQDRYQREKEYHNKAFAEDLRHSVDKYYETIQSSRLAHRQAMSPLEPGTLVLEYGCGPGSAAFDLAARGAQVVGIDISEVAIEQSRAKAQELGLVIDFRCMNAESLEFEDNTFDMIVGSAILHHLDLDKAYAELSRCLKPGGRAVFIEPTGHNPLLNLYRRMTPALRTVDERPMRRPDFDRAQRYFSNVQVRYYNIRRPRRRLHGHQPEQLLRHESLSPDRRTHRGPELALGAHAVQRPRRAGDDRFLQA